MIVFGKIKIVDDEKVAIEKIRNLGYKYFPDKESADIVLEKHAKSAFCLELTIEHMTGKLVNES